MNKILHHAGLGVTLLFGFSAYSNGQSAQAPSAASSQDEKSRETVVVSDVTSTVRVADPNELIAVNGHVMRVAEFMAFLSANTSLAQRLRNLENQNSSGSPQAAPKSRTHSDSPSPAAAPAEEKASPSAATPEKH